MSTILELQKNQVKTMSTVSVERQSNPSRGGEYVLATGGAGANRLRILHDVYGPGVRDLLIRAGIQRGRELLKPGGTIVCEDGDLTSAGSEPPSKLQEFSNLFGALGPKWGVDYTLGRRLFQMVLGANFSQAEITLNQPVFAQGENKRLLELSVAEAGPSFVKAGLLTNEELTETLAEMRRLSDDQTVLALMPRMSQVWARK
jgi:hypothetical protein